MCSVGNGSVAETTPGIMTHAMVPAAIVVPAPILMPIVLAMMPAIPFVMAAPVIVMISCLMPARRCCLRCRCNDRRRSQDGDSKQRRSGKLHPGGHGPNSCGFRQINAQDARRVPKPS
jgi:hypothetical protein